MRRLLVLTVICLTAGANGSEWKEAKFRVVPNEPTFKACDSNGTPLGTAELYRMSIDDGVTPRDTSVFEAIPNKTHPTGGFFEFLAFRVSERTHSNPSSTRNVYIGFKNRKDPRAKKLYRLLEAVTLLQLDGKIGSVEFDLQPNQTRLAKDYIDEFYLIEPEQIKLRLMGNESINAALLIENEFIAEPHAYLSSLVANNDKSCERLLNN